MSANNNSAASVAQYASTAVAVVEPYLQRVDALFGESRFFSDLACRAKVPRKFLTSGIVLLAFCFFVFGLGQSLLSVLVGAVWPAYCSMRALETPNKEDDVQWCVAGFVGAAARARAATRAVGARARSPFASPP